MVEKMVDEMDVKMALMKVFLKVLLLVQELDFYLLVYEVMDL